MFYFSMRTLQLTCLVACCLITFLARSQGYHPPTTLNGHFGLKFGAQTVKTAIQGTTPLIAKNSTEFNLGLIYRLRYRKYVLQPELLYNVKGGSFTLEQSTGSTVTHNNYNYLSVPVMFGYIPTEGITLQLGPEFSYALNTTASNGPAVRNDIGIAIGAHYDFLDMLSQLSLNARYVYGFINIAPADAQASYYNRAFQLSLVYNLYKKEK